MLAPVIKVCLCVAEKALKKKRKRLCYSVFQIDHLRLKALCQHQVTKSGLGAVTTPDGLALKMCLTLPC